LRISNFGAKSRLRSQFGALGAISSDCSYFERREEKRREEKRREEKRREEKRREEKRREEKDRVRNCYGSTSK
jgi:hypothetical protein